MGKRSKSNKNKNTRALHHGRVKNAEKVFDDTLRVSKERGHERERLELLETSLNLLVETKLSYFVLNKRDLFTKKFYALHFTIRLST